MTPAGKPSGLLWTALAAALLAAAPVAAAQPLGRLFNTPAERGQLDSQRNAPPAAAPNEVGGPPGMAPADANQPGANGGTPPPAPPEILVLNGTLRTSGGRSTVWLNDVPQRGKQLQLPQRQRGAAQLTVRLPSGQTVLLKPGQRYDLRDGKVKDVNEP